MTTSTADGRVGNRIENYNGFWKEDLRREDEGATEKRLDSYTEVVNGRLSIQGFHIFLTTPLYLRLL